MKLSSRFVAPFLAAGLVAAAASAAGAGTTRYVPTVPSDVVAPSDACTPETLEAFSRIAVRATSESTAKGTLRGVLSTPDILFSEIYGSASVELALIGTVGGSPWATLSPTIDVVKNRGKWVYTKGTIVAGSELAVTTFKVRPNKDGTIGSMTLKWVADLSMETWTSIDDGSLEFGALITFHDGSTACGGGID